MSISQQPLKWRYTPSRDQSSSQSLILSLPNGLNLKYTPSKGSSGRPSLLVGQLDPSSGSPKGTVFSLDASARGEPIEYRGETERGKKGGLGMMDSKRGRYFGYFRNDKKEGLGILSYPGGQMEGRFSNNQFCLFGKFTDYASGGTFIGDYNNKSILEGIGADGEYLGGYKGGLRHGIGRVTKILEEEGGQEGSNDENREVTIGVWDKGQQNGFCISMSTSSKYEGWNRHSPPKDPSNIPMGRLKTPEYSYIGQFKNNLFHGFGQLEDSRTGYKYLGNFSKGFKDGLGFEAYNDGQGEIFFGYFKKDQRNGMGTMKVLENMIKNTQGLEGSSFNLKSEVEFHGTWADDKMNGNFMVIEPESQTQQFAHNVSKTGWFYQNNSRIRQLSPHDLSDLEKKFRMPEFNSFRLGAIHNIENIEEYIVKQRKILLNTDERNRRNYKQKLDILNSQLKNLKEKQVYIKRIDKRVSNLKSFLEESGYNYDEIVKADISRLKEIFPEKEVSGMWNTTERDEMELNSNKRLSACHSTLSIPVKKAYPRVKSVDHRSFIEDSNLNNEPEEILENKFEHDDSPDIKRDKSLSAFGKKDLKSTKKKGLTRNKTDFSGMKKSKSVKPDPPLKPTYETEEASPPKKKPSSSPTKKPSKKKASKPSKPKKPSSKPTSTSKPLSKPNPKPKQKPKPKITTSLVSSSPPPQEESLIDRIVRRGRHGKNVVGRTKEDRGKGGREREDRGVIDMVREEIQRYYSQERVRQEEEEIKRGKRGGVEGDGRPAIPEQESKEEEVPEVPIVPEVPEVPVVPIVELWTPCEAFLLEKTISIEFAEVIKEKEPEIQIQEVEEKDEKKPEKEIENKKPEAPKSLKQESPGRQSPAKQSPAKGMNPYFDDDDEEEEEVFTFGETIADKLDKLHPEKTDNPGLESILEEEASVIMSPQHNLKLKPKSIKKYLDPNFTKILSTERAANYALLDQHGFKSEIFEGGIQKSACSGQSQEDNLTSSNPNLDNQLPSQRQRTPSMKFSVNSDLQKCFEEHNNFRLIMNTEQKAKKFAVSEDAKRLVLAGDSKLWLVELHPLNVDQFFTRKVINGMNVSDLKFSDSHLYVQRKKFNDLQVFTQSRLNKAFRLEGCEDTDGLEVNINLSFTDNDLCIPWYRGRGNLEIYFIKTNQSFSIQRFFLDENTQEKLNPLFCLTTPRANQVFAVCMGLSSENAEEKDENVFIYWAKGKRSQFDASELKIDMTVLCGETSTDTRVVVLGGEIFGRAAICSVSFDRYLKVMHQKKLNTFPMIQTMKRYQFTSIYLLGCVSTVLIVEYDSNRESFNEISMFRTEGCSDILEIRTRLNKIFVLDSKGKVFVRISGDIPPEVKITHDQQADAHALNYQRASSSTLMADLLKSINLTAHLSNIIPDMPDSFDCHEALKTMDLIDFEPFMEPLPNIKKSFEDYIIKECVDNVLGTYSMGLSTYQQDKNRFVLGIREHIEVFEFQPHTSSYQKVCVNTPDNRLKVQVASIFCKNEFMFIQEMKTNNLIVYRLKDFKEIMTLEGERNHSSQRDMETLVIKNPTDSNGPVFWFSGGITFSWFYIQEGVTFCNEKEPEILTYDKYFKGDQKNDIFSPNYIIMNGKKILSLCKDIEENYFLKVHDTDKKKEKWLDMTPLNAIEQKRHLDVEKIIESALIENSGRSGLFYLAGKCKVIGAKTGKLVNLLCAVKLSSKLVEVVDYFHFTELAYPASTCITAMNRFQGEAKQEYIVLAVDFHISIISLSPKFTLTEIVKIERIFETSIRDILFSAKNLTFLACSVQASKLKSIKVANCFKERSEIDYLNFTKEEIKLDFEDSHFKLSLSYDGKSLFARGKTNGVSINLSEDSSEPTFSNIELPSEDVTYWVGLMNGNWMNYRANCCLITSISPDLKEIDPVQVDNPTSMTLNQVEQLSNFKVQNHENRYFMIPKNSYDLLFIDIERKKWKDLCDFFAQKPLTGIIPQAAITNSTADLIIGLAQTPRAQHLIINQEFRESTRIEVCEKLSGNPRLNGLDVDREKDHLFMYGTFVKTNNAFVAAHILDKMLKKVAVHEITSASGISKVFRLKDTNRLLAAGINMIYVVDFLTNEKKFHQLAAVQAIEPSFTMSDILMRADRIYVSYVEKKTLSVIKF